MAKFNFRNFYNLIFKNHAAIYKFSLFILTAIAIVYFFPKGGHFKYDFQNGKPWEHDNYYAPFDFSILKSDEQLKNEEEAILANRKLYFNYDESTKTKVKSILNTNLKALAQDSLFQSINVNRLVEYTDQFINTIYTKGLITVQDQNKAKPKQLVGLRKGNEVSTVVFDNFFNETTLFQYLETYFDTSRYKTIYSEISSLLLKSFKPNVTYDSGLTEKLIQEELNTIAQTEGLVTENERIISKGDLVQGRKYAILNSLRKEYTTQQWNDTNYNWILFGYILLVALALLMLFLFLQKYRGSIFEDNTKITFIFFNVFLMFLLVTMVVKYKADYLYVVPLPILPIVIKAFFDARLAFFAHVLTVLLLGFVVPNSFEFVFLQIIAGMITILTVTALHQRANLFISISKVTGVYMVTYFAFTVIQEGSTQGVNWEYFAMFALNGVLSFLALFLILVYEKLFGLVSDVSLLELSNTNSKLLRLLAEKAPGTFQHSMQVANLAEASANEIGANAMLVRTGALYHDIGKMHNPNYFTENQSTSVNPHNELPPKDSASIIIEHVLKGIEMARKHRLPDRIIDFIRTHHGTSLVYYFYKKEEELNPELLNMEDFRYPGPIPFSKETAILMMCDAAEAASKSLKDPSAQGIDDLIEKIVAGQMAQGQFMNSDITFKEIQLIKKVIKKKLNNIYQLRIEYPE